MAALVDVIYKEELSKKVDALELAQEAVRAGLISQNVLDHLTSLHPSIPNSTKNRYLCSQVESRNKKLLVNVIKKLILLSEPMSGPVANILLTSEHLFDLCEVLIDYAYKWESIGIALRFKPQDLKNIEANQQLLLDAPSSYLRTLLGDWLEKKHKHAKHPTLSALQKALRSCTVGLGTVAESIQAKLTTSTVAATDSTVPYSLTNISVTSSPSYGGKRVSMTTSGRKYMYIEENSAVLLEVQVASDREVSSYTYQWLKNGEPIQARSWDEDKQNFFGVSGPVLCIPKADIDYDGCEFACKVTASWKKRPIITTPTVFRVSCPLDAHRDSLASIYLAKSELPEDTWPPVSNEKYINLALIKENKTNLCEHYVHHTIRGDMDDILQHKEIIKHEHVLKGIRSRQALFIAGRPGCGKTTFVHKITRDWATGSLLRHMRLVLLVSLRVLNNLNKPTLDLSDILQMFEDLKVSQELLEKRHGKGVCFIFDGFDEFSPQEGGNSIVHKIIKKEYLRKSTVILVSRPAALAYLRNKANLVIEVLGFKKEQILEYFDSYTFSRRSISKASELKAYLLSHPNILHMCYLPIHAAMVAFLFEVTGKVPQTETEMYTHFTHLTILRNLSKNRDMHIEDINVHKLKGEEEQLLNQICKLALEKTKLNKQVLHQDDVNFICRKDRDISLGLITIDRTASLYGYKDSYTFLHLTFQEYLAALHISKLSDEEQNTLIHTLGKAKHMLVVWKFYCGLVRNVSRKFKEILRIVNPKTLFCLQCAYESQQREACDIALDHQYSSLSFGSHYFSTPELLAVRYVVENATSPFSLKLQHCKINIEALALAFSNAGENKMLHTFNYTVEVLKVEDIEILEILLSHFTSIRCLQLTATYKRSLCSLDGVAVQNSITELRLYRIPVNKYCLSAFLNNRRDLHTVVLRDSIGAAEVEVLVEYLTDCNVKKLDISANDLTDPAAKLLARGLAFCTSLEDISIKHNMFSNEAVRSLLHNLHRCSLKIHSVTMTPNMISTDELIENLKNCSQIQELHITDTLNEKASKRFASQSKDWKNLHTLELSECISNAQTADIADGLKMLTSLEHLTISYNSFDASGAKELAKGLQKCTSLQSLNISWNCNIKESGIKFLVSGFDKCHLRRLQTLDLSYNYFGDQGAVILSDHIKHMTGLSVLRLAGNKISTKGVRVITNSLKHCHALTVLDLRDNIIGIESSQYITTSLQYWPNLTELGVPKALAGMKQHCGKSSLKFNNIVFSNISDTKTPSPNLPNLSERPIYVNLPQGLHLDHPISTNLPKRPIYVNLPIDGMQHQNNRTD